MHRDDNTVANTPDQAKNYDAAARDFAEKAPQLLTWQFGGKPLFDKMLKEFFGRKDIKIVDLGAGSGRVEDYLIGNGVSASNITAVEISPKEVEIGKSRLPEVDFRVGDVRTVGLPKNAYDLAISHMVFEHVDDEGLLNALQNANSALKDNGTLVFIATHPGKMTASDGVNKKGWFTTSAPWGGTVDNYFREIQDFVEAVEKAGFVIDSIEEFEMEAEAKIVDPVKYEKYNSYGPLRLGIKAHKA